MPDQVWHDEYGFDRHMEINNNNQVIVALGYKNVKKVLITGDSHENGALVLV